MLSVYMSLHGQAPLGFPTPRIQDAMKNEEKEPEAREERGGGSKPPLRHYQCLFVSITYSFLTISVLLF